MNCTRLRQALARRGVTPASWIPEGSGGRVEEATIRPARLVEGMRLETHAVGEAVACDEPLAFLDGTQRAEVVGYWGAAPILVAEVAAAVRRREDRRLRTAVQARRTVAIGRAAALEAAGEALEGFERLPLAEGEPGHPARDLIAAGRLVDQARGNLELAVGDRYLQEYDGWVLVDGSLAVSPGWAANPRLIGISKSHATLPFDGRDLERYLRLAAGHRSSIFEPASRSFAPVRAWALRLRAWEGQDLFHGLVRIEVAPALGIPEIADRLSRWLLAERAPVSTPDPRWDRLLYGIHGVEQYLKASR